MKGILLNVAAVLFTAHLTLTAQVLDSARIKDLNIKVEETTGVNRLQYLDTLTKLIEFNEDHAYTDRMNQAIKLGLSLDSLDLATRLTNDLIYYQNSILNTPADGLKLFKEFEPMAKKLNNKSTLANFYLYAGDSYYGLGQFTEAIRVLKKSRMLAREAGNTSRSAHALMRLGYVYGAQGEFSNSSQNLQEAIKLFSQERDTTNLVNAKNSLSILYSQNAFYKEAKKERDEAIELSDKDAGNLSTIYYNAANDAREQGNLEEWAHQLHKALAQSKKWVYKDYIQAYIYPSLVTVNAQMGDLAKAQAYLDTIEASPQKFAEGTAHADYLDALKNIAFAKADLPQALSYGKAHLAEVKKKESFVELYNAEKFLARVNKEMGNNTAFLTHQNAYYRIKDSVQNAQKVNALAYYQTLYETEKRDTKIRDQQANIALLQEREKVRKQWIIMGIILILAAALFTYLKLRQRQRSEKQKYLDELRTQISADLHDDIGPVLTGLAMQSEILEAKAPDEYGPQLHRIASLSRAAMVQMRDAVWVMDARKDNWGALLDRIREFASDNLVTREIAYDMKTSGIESDMAIATPLRQTLYLVVKEAIANTLKHSGATRVSLNLEQLQDTIHLTFSDNGNKELKTRSSFAGLGLDNMKRRADLLKGKIEFHTTEGFEIFMTLPKTIVP